ncbi:hypothetical protein NTG1052_140091 [Candidatus Nitrotoga sp. 1052]|nr:hypothetical protein NTG1052_140091 [Candidatus Nitrotoga sp. 1052]
MIHDRRRRLPEIPTEEGRSDATKERATRDCNRAVRAISRRRIGVRRVGERP